MGCALTEVELAVGLVHLANSRTCLGEDSGIAQAREAVELLERHRQGHADTYAMALCVLTNTLQAAGRHAEVAEVAPRAVAAARDLTSHDRLLLQTLKHWSLALTRSHVELLPVAAETVAVARRLGDDVELAMALRELGQCLLRLDRPAEARTAAEESVAIWRRLGTPSTETAVLRSRRLLDQLA
jgi:hypothetical protein